jgi:hypothetical protein
MWISLESDGRQVPANEVITSKKDDRVIVRIDKDYEEKQLPPLPDPRPGEIIPDWRY